MHYLVKDCLRGAKSLSQLHSAIVRLETKGNVFLYHDQPDQETKIEAARKRAEELALEWIRESLDSIPKRIKRDIEVMN